MLSNNSGADKPVMLIPDGRIDLIAALAVPYGLTLLALETHASERIIPSGLSLFAISFKPLALEYLLRKGCPPPDIACSLPVYFLGVSIEAFDGFQSFCAKLSVRLPKYS